MPPPSFRYFLGFQPDPLLCELLVRLGSATGQSCQRVAASKLHLTLCVVAETSGRDLHIAENIAAALAGSLPAAAPIRLGRVQGGQFGASLKTRGRKGEILDLYAQLVTPLIKHGIKPLHRKSGLHPHITLGYDHCAFDTFLVAHYWLPDTLLLIESHAGTHNIINRWTLAPPRQAFFAFGSPATARMKHAQAARTCPPSASC